MRAFSSSTYSAFARSSRLICGGLLLILVAAASTALAQEEEPLRDARSVVEEVPAGYSLVAESSHLQLYMELESARIAVRDRRSSQVWLSTPSATQSEEIPDSLRENFGSVFFAYLTRGQSTQARRENSVTKVSDIRIERTANGAVVWYEMEELEVSLALRYELGPDYLNVALDEAGMVESDLYRFVAVELLPYLGSTPYLAETEAYFVLPDGPGALTHVGGPQPGTRSKFSAAAFGSHTYFFGQPPEQHTPLAAFGIVHPAASATAGEGEAEGGAVLGVATLGAGDTSIEANVSHNELAFSRANIRLIYRRLAQFPMRQGVFKQYYESDSARGDRAIRYFFLAGEEASWVGLAQRLRQHLIEDRGVRRLGSGSDGATGGAGRAALRLRLVMGAEKPGLLWRRFVTATSFDEAEEIVHAFHAANMTELDVVLMGWENDGYEGNLPKRLPPDRRLGGKQGLRDLVAAVHGLRSAEEGPGARIFLESDFTLAILENGGFLPVTDVVLQSNLLPVSDLISYGLGQEVPRELRRNRFFLNAVYATERYLLPEMPRLAALGVDGLELRWAGELLLPDANPIHPLQRSEGVAAWRRMLSIAADATGSVAAQGGNAYVLGIADTITQFPLYRNNYVFADETVPFYPIATHGLVRLYGEPTNLDDDPQRDFLRRLEYGMLPAYELTYREPLVLVRTTYPELYSSQYLDWMERAARAYDVAVVRLGHTVGQFIVGHRQLAPQVFETTYEDGTRVIVNYGGERFTGAGVQVEPLGYAIASQE